MMENTLDSISPCNSNPQDEMSYLFGRDPSILAYGQRPCVSKETKKNLLSVYETEEYSDIEESSSLNSVSQNTQTLKVYMRMKPFPKKIKLSQEQQDAYQIINSTTLLTRLPTLDNNASCLKRSNSSDVVCKKFSFTKTFGPETTQLELFEEAVKQQMVDFLAGQNSTIMTYGTTNSGKSYTLQGTTASPGIIPSCLEFLFSNITPKSTPSYKPINHCDVVTLDPLERAQELEIKTKLLTFASVDKYQYINAYQEMQKVLQEESPIRPSQCIDAHYSIWVSFAEIYNEIMYDLLSNECQKKRTPLKLATDSQGRAFIKGLKNVCVNSGSEAYQVLMAGQYNLKVAATALNARSSRSHCIFTIKLLKYYIENEPNSVEVSTFAFGDLAGSERLKKTLNIGDRLKEAQNINTSLLVLGRCLKTIHEGQLSKQKIKCIGPFRESKLTRLFQKALSGKEHIALIVNINPVPMLYVETQNVLSFSAIATKIVIEKEKVWKKPKPRFSHTVTQSIKTISDSDATEVENSEWQSILDDNASNYVRAEIYDELVCENEKLKKDIATLKSSTLTHDIEIRQEMADTYTNMIKDLEREWKNHMKDVEKQQEDVLQWTVKHVEDYYNKKLDHFKSRKRRRTSLSENSFDQDSKDIEELEIENSRLLSKVELLKNNVKELKEKNQTSTVEKNKISFELGLVKEDLKSVKKLLTAAQEDVCSDENTLKYVEEVKSQLFAKQEQVKELKVFLNEAKEEYIAITTEVREKENEIKEQEEELIEKQEKIDNLEADLARTLMWLTQKTEAVDSLEEKLENQTQKIVDHDNKMQDMQEQINKLKNEKLSLLKEIELLKKTVVRQSVIPEIIIEGPPENNKSIQTEHDEFETDVKEKVIAIEAENSALNEKLVCTTTEIQSLKEELGSAKVQLKDISEQIHNLQISNVAFTAENDKDTDKKVKVVETAEIGCQMEIEFEEQCKETPKIDLLNRSSQTIDSSMKEAANQTSFTQETDDYEVILDELAKLMVKYDDVKKQYEEKCVKLNTLQADFDNHILKCKTEHEEKISNLQQELSSATEKNNLKSQCLDVHAAKIIELEHSLGGVAELQEKIGELNKNLEICQTEKEHLQKLLDENNNRLLDFKGRLEHAEKKEREKDEEIIFLQKEMKQMINTTENDCNSDKLMEAELKSTIKELIAANEVISRKEEYIGQLELRVKHNEQNAKVLEQTAQERQGENQKLRSMNEELKNSLIEKEHEMETFMKNREEMMTKYERLVKSQQEELENKRRELTKSHSKGTDYYENTSEDEVALKERRTRRPPKKYIPSSPKQSEVSVIEPSGSESKLSGKCINIPHLEQFSERKRTTRKKKLYMGDDSCQDIEPLETTINTAASAKTRSLRSKRK